MIEALSKLDKLVKEGKILEAFDTYFADNVITSDEIGNITSSKAEKRALLEGFFRDFKNHEEITLFDSFTDDDTSYSNFRFVFQKESGEKFQWDEVIIRKWKDNLVVSEFYSNQNFAELKNSLAEPATKKADPAPKKTVAKTAAIKKEEATESVKTEEKAAATKAPAAKAPAAKAPAKKASAAKPAAAKKTK
jgi:hypothetical protein